MDKDIKEKWLKALRSGDYQQCTGELVKELDNGSRGYCCLGVLAEIVDPAREHPSWQGYDSELLPIEFAKELGLESPEVVSTNHRKSSDPEVKDTVNGNKDTLSGMNDSGSSFAEIADVIEEQL